METVNELPKEVEDLIKQQEELINEMTLHLESVNEGMQRATGFLVLVTPPEGVIKDLRMMVLGEMKRAKEEPVNQEWVDSLEKCDTWLNVFQEEEE